MGGAARIGPVLAGPATGLVVVLVLAGCGVLAGGLLLATRLGAARERRRLGAREWRHRRHPRGRASRRLGRAAPQVVPGGVPAGDLEVGPAAAVPDDVSGERGLVAVELHDIVSHAVSVMVLQAAGARRVIEREPQRAAQALAEIERLGRDAMGELRRLHAVLRDAALVPDDAVRLAPPRGLADLPGLADRIRDRGVPIRLEQQGRPVPLDASVDLAAYRIVAHALERVAVRGGPAVSAVVRQVWTAEVLILEIVGERMAPVAAGAAGAARAAWAGPRERAVLAGGRLEVVCLPDGGGRLVVTLPVASRTPLSRRPGAAGPR